MSLYLLNTHSHRKLMPNDNKKKQMESRSAPSACSYSKPEHWSRSSRVSSAQIVQSHFKFNLVPVEGFLEVHLRWKEIENTKV